MDDEAIDLRADLHAQDDDGQVRFTILPGSISQNRHLVDRASA